MDTEKTRRNDAAREASSTKAAAGLNPVDAQHAEEMKAHGDRHDIAQAARAVMHPERHELEWRFFHGAVNG